MAHIPNNSDETIDSRDIIKRIKSLENLDDADDAEREELQILLNLQEQAKDSADWQYGEALIRDSYFEEYVYGLAEDMGAIDINTKWPHTCIDWERATEEMQMNFFSVDFDGVDYWIWG